MLSRMVGQAMALVCQNCGNHDLRRRRAASDPEAQCMRCGAIIPNVALRTNDIRPDSDNRNRIQLAAGEMARRYGSDAPRQAARRAGEALALGSMNKPSCGSASSP